ncbi:sulfite exporter TauE/SafE family protein [Burkholderia pseudomultivorans]|uniref:sulfite exporter TauE/SafE family protein n=1 Tax=Burkholderia pseudomultivorans TaxID=1207504 RepID=UPI0028766E44|nr:sulfite exporter TauE/SafE family protein [Burkholderia pseudomultivorans]MDS0796067.1 sulfite exporter TauE/SafE family protein [Burkholderia pseudomultivorans]
MLTSLILGSLVGAVLGMTGAGGGILAVPALVAGMGWSMQQATPVALIAVAGSAAIGTAEAWRRRLVRYRAALVMTAAGMPMTSLGVRLAHRLPQRLLMLMFALVMLVVAIRLLRQAARGAIVSTESRWCVARIDPDSGRIAWNPLSALSLAATGALTGLMTGLLGVGGGFIIVPMLRKLTNITMHGIVATSLMVIALVGIGGIASTMLQGAAPPIEFTALFTVTTALGMVTGRMVARKLSVRHIQMGFAGILVLIAVGMAIKAIVGG